MAMFELFGVGRSWAGAFKADPLGDRRPSVVPDSPVSSTVSINDVSSASVSRRALDGLRTASGALQAAFGSFVRETRPVLTTTTVGRAGTAASVIGTSARVEAIHFDYHGLQTTNEVNSRTSTVRTSWGALGLDTTTPDALSMLASSSDLGLDTVGAASVKESKAEMNAGMATSYSSSSLTFADGGSTSTSIGSLSGTYQGSGKAADATSLQFTVTKGGAIDSGGLLGLGKTKIAFDVTDQTGEQIFSYSGNVAAGDTISLGNDIGLSFTVGAGILTAGHTASIAVSKTAMTVDPNARFDAVPGVRPQFDAVSQVNAGSFTVNGTLIDVYADDTINAVLDRISSSAAGVTATLSGDRVTLTTIGNSDQNIDITGDTSGFIKAVRLDGTSTAKGNLRDDERLLRDTAVFKDVRTGSFTINGRTIAVDRDRDTLATLLARINESGAGVTAGINLATNRIELVSHASSEDLIVVGNDTTGFLAKALLDTANTVVGNIRDDGKVLGDLFAGVTSGSFLVNGVAISVDKDADTLASVVSRINGSDAGVIASYDAATDRFTFTPETAGSTLSIEGDTTGLLAALKVATGTAATHANADGAFNAPGVAGPLFDAGFAVQAGSFTVNGVAIVVAADDSINTVLAKITASAAGVTATYDDATDRVSLTARDSGAPVTLGADTSGFLAAVKLDGTANASVSAISYSPFNTALGEMAEYAGVTTGTLTVNGRAIAIDPMSTTIAGLVGALNGIDGVSASIDQSSGAVRIWADRAGSLTLSDTSGVLDALGIEAGTVHGMAGSIEEVTTVTAQSTSSNASEVAAKVAAAIKDLNAALEGVSSDGLRAALEAAAESLREQGIGGVGAGVEDDNAVLVVSNDELIASLDVIGGGVDLERVLSGVLETLAAAVARALDPDDPPAGAQVVRLELFRTQFMAEQAAGSLLHARTSLQPGDPPAATRKTALKAYEIVEAGI